MGRWNRRTSTGDPESGSLIVDAAVCLPIFLIAAGLLILLLMQAGTEDTVVRAAADASLTCVEAAAGMEAVEAGAAESVLQAAFYAGKLHAYLGKEWDDGPDVWVTGFLPDQKSLAAGNLRIDHLVRATVTTRRKALHGLDKTDGILSLRRSFQMPGTGTLIWIAAALLVVIVALVCILTIARARSKKRRHKKSGKRRKQAQ